MQHASFLTVLSKTSPNIFSECSPHISQLNLIHFGSFPVTISPVYGKFGCNCILRVKRISDTHTRRKLFRPDIEEQRSEKSGLKIRGGTTVFIILYKRVTYFLIFRFPTWWILMKIDSWIFFLNHLSFHVEGWCTMWWRLDNNEYYTPNNNGKSFNERSPVKPTIHRWAHTQTHLITDNLLVS